MENEEQTEEEEVHNPCINKKLFELGVT